MSKYKVVPVEATMEMCDEMLGYAERDSAYGYDELLRDYADMIDASPDTGMVAVPRELLESAVTWLDVHSSSTGSAEWSVADDLRTILEKANG